MVVDWGLGEPRGRQFGRCACGFTPALTPFEELTGFGECEDDGAVMCARGGFISLRPISLRPGGLPGLLLLGPRKGMTL